MIILPNIRTTKANSLLDNTKILEDMFSLTP